MLRWTLRSCFVIRITRVVFPFCFAQSIAVLTSWILAPSKSPFFLLRDLTPSSLGLCLKNNPAKLCRTNAPQTKKIGILTCAQPHLAPPRTGILNGHRQTVKSLLFRIISCHGKQNYTGHFASSRVKKPPCNEVAWRWGEGRVGERARI